MPDHLNEIPIRMTKVERDLFVKHLTGKTTYLEYGCGGSTRIAAQLGITTIVSVETDLDWINKLKQEPEINAQHASGSIIFDHIDLGPVK